MPRAPSAIERLILYDRAVLVSALAVVTALAWIYLLAGAGTGMSVWAMSTWHFPPDTGRLTQAAGHWTVFYFLLMLAMWWVMMIAMMMPSAAPVILLYARVMRHSGANAATGLFVLGYLAAWFGFSLAASLAQWLFESLALTSPTFMWSRNQAFTVLLLLAAGGYQISPLKRSCLRACQSPAAFIARYQQPGYYGALLIGLRHGLFCIGCCAMLMLLLFAGGLMNLVWVAGLSVLVLVEKLAPARIPVAAASGLVLISSGVLLLLANIMGTIPGT